MSLRPYAVPERSDDQSIVISHQQMLVLTYDYDHAVPRLIIHREPHFWRRRRIYINDHIVPADDLATVLDDYAFCEHIGSCLGYMPYKDPPCYYEHTLASFHPRISDGLPVLRIDRERPGAHRPLERHYLRTITLPPYEQSNNGLLPERVTYAIGRFVCEQLLPYEPGFAPD